MEAERAREHDPFPPPHLESHLATAALESRRTVVDPSQFVASRSLGAASHLFILARVQIIVTIVLCVTLLDFAIAGSMREALRYAVVDAPRQFPAIVIGVLLACAAIRFTCEAMIELISPDLFNAPGNMGRLTNFLPRLLPILIGFSTGFPLLRLALDENALGGADNRIFAAAYGLIFLATGLLVGLVGKGPSAPVRGILTTQSSFLLRLSLALLPLGAAVALAGTVWGYFPSDDPGHYLGISHGAMDRYLEGKHWLRFYHGVVEGLAIFLIAVFTRFAFNIVVYLLAPSAMTAEGPTGQIAALIPRVAAVSIGLVLAFQVIDLYAPDVAGDVTESFLLLGIALAFTMTALAAALVDGSLSVVTDSSTVFQRIGSRWLRGADRMAALHLKWRLFFALLIVGWLVITIAFLDVSQVERAQAIGPITVILLWGFAATALFFPIAYMSHATRTPLMLILLTAGMGFAGFALNDNHQLRGAGEEIDPNVETAAAAGETSYYGETVDLGEWIKSRRDWRAYDHYPIFLVATEGGGIRAAYFTASVLAALQEKCPGFAQHLLAVSSVSGGSVGAAVFAGQVAEQVNNVARVGCRAKPVRPGWFVSRARNVLGTDLLSPLLSAAMFPDALQRILPLPINAFDRARALEFALELSWRENTPACPRCDPERMGEKVETLYERADVRPPVPHLSLNTTEAGTGRTMPFATWNVFADLKMPTVSKNEALALPRAPMVHLQQRIPKDEVPLSAAAMVSARFPYLTPAARVGDVGHYVDGGYFENSGTWLLSSIAQGLIMQQLAYTNEDKDLERAVKNAVIVAVVIRSEPCTRDEENDRCEELGSGNDAAQTWNELLSPVRALLYTRDKRAEYSISDLSTLTSLVQELRAQMGAARMKANSDCQQTICAVTITFRNAPKVEVPLTWVLSSRARSAMDEAVNQILAENLWQPAPPAETRTGNRIEGAYRRIMCLLDPVPDGCSPEGLAAD